MRSGAIPYEPSDTMPIVTQRPWLPSIQSRICSSAACAADAADECPRALIIAALSDGRDKDIAQPILLNSALHRRAANRCKADVRIHCGRMIPPDNQPFK